MGFKKYYTRRRRCRTGVLGMNLTKNRAQSQSLAYSDANTILSGLDSSGTPEDLLLAEFMPINTISEEPSPATMLITTGTCAYRRRYFSKTLWYWAWTPQILVKGLHFNIIFSPNISFSHFALVYPIFCYTIDFFFPHPFLLPSLTQWSGLIAAITMAIFIFTIITILLVLFLGFDAAVGQPLTEFGDHHSSSAAPPKGVEESWWSCSPQSKRQCRWTLNIYPDHDCESDQTMKTEESTRLWTHLLLIPILKIIE